MAERGGPRVTRAAGNPGGLQRARAFGAGTQPRGAGVRVARFVRRRDALGPQGSLLSKSARSRGRERLWGV